MDQSLAEQEREIRELVRRAERTPVTTSPQRREALKRLIDLSRSPHAHLKKFAASNITKFFKDFPDLDEDAINAIYDLCEDQDSKVRIDGYKAIVQMSKEQPKWVKRNTDVLVQLLQSDEPDEVTVVKKALAEHLDMDPKVTLGVLCDQIVSADEPVDEEDKAIRDRLRSLVIAFMCGEAKRAIVARHANQPGNPQETVLIEGLFKAVSKPSASGDAHKIIKDILLFLPSFRSQSTPRGNELLQLLIDQARLSIKEDLAVGNDPASIELGRYYLDLAALISVEKNVSDPAHLLQFYSTSLLGNTTLSKLSQDAQLFVITHVSETLSACISRARGSTDHQQVSSIRRQIVDTSPTLIQHLVQSRLTDNRLRKACETILTACQQRLNERAWSVPSSMIPQLEQLSQAVGEQPGPKSDKLQDLIRSLLQRPATPSRPSPIPRPPVNVSHAHLPVRPASGAGKRKLETNGNGNQTGSASLSIRGQQARELQARNQGLSERPRAQTLTAPQAQVASTSAGIPGSGLHPSKRFRASFEDDRPAPSPSLLERLKPQSGNGDGNGSGNGGRNVQMQAPRKAVTAATPPVREHQHQHQHQRQHDASHAQGALVGLSIKGAARAAAGHPPAQPPRSSSLLERMERESLVARIDGGEGDVRRKKRKGNP
ncbi:hypothetical protein EVG20_g1382 [Dentipellis fragilis]|uniref:Apoptosis inhibitor 5 n=1 Tax=Dentipellis fragilis TaxID=205917 RepID=A0A4Y9ZCC0_9AGAM|nr:hypothetical protein EVG20_g1382 [Dentipellis fragilis]